MTTTVTKGRWYPAPPPALDGEDDDAYTDRLTGARGEDLYPYDHPRNRQCSIGWHSECTDPEGLRCKCPHHYDGEGLEPAGDPLEDAATALSRCYDLPLRSSLAVLLKAEVRMKMGEDVAGVRAYLGELYGSEIGEGFGIDVVNILRALPAGWRRN